MPVHINPDLIRTVFQLLIEDQLHTDMEMGRIDIVHILFSAVAGSSGIADDVAGPDSFSDIQIGAVGTVFSQMAVVIIALFVKAPYPIRQPPY